MTRFPILTILAGILFIVAGISSYYGISLGYLVPLILIVAGAGVILLAFTGQRPQWGSVALFIIALIVVTTAVPVFNPGGAQVITYSATKSHVSAQIINLVVSATFGSIKVLFSNASDVAYQVKFARPFVFFNIPVVGGDYKLTNSTSGNALTLTATASAAEITVTLGKGYLTNINASATTGSINLADRQGERLGKVILSATLGSVDATLNTNSLRSLRLQTTTGSVNLQSDSFSTNSRLAPVSLSTTLGSVSATLKIPSNIAVTLTGSTSTGSISRSLQGFNLSQDTRNGLAAAAGDIATAGQSFMISATAETGSISLNIQLVSQ